MACRPNGIPPLEYPTHLAVADDAAGYLDDDHIVFGVAMNGETRAYPKRILAWHEMVLDTIGGVELTIVYCTLCGTVIPYESVVDGQHITFGTSGLLYRSNKLMFDHGTKSLWNTFEGVPVVGASVGSRIKLRHRSVVTTTWGEWRRTHPETTVLSLETGHQRDYSEGRGVSRVLRDRSADLWRLAGGRSVGQQGGGRRHAAGGHRPGRGTPLPSRRGSSITIGCITPSRWAASWWW